MPGRFNAVDLLHPREADAIHSAAFTVALWGPAGCACCLRTRDKEKYCAGQCWTSLGVRLLACKSMFLPLACVICRWCTAHEAERM